MKLFPNDTSCNNNIVCSKCQQSFACEMNSRNQSCWCNDIPTLIPVPDTIINEASINGASQSNKTCLCQSCLTEVIAERINDAIKTKSLKQMIALAKPYRNQENFVESIDYTIENGNYVFSKWYHLKRGSCCGNGCRNCPYIKY